MDKLKKQTAPLWLLGCGLGVESVITLVQVRSDPGAALARLVIGVGLGTVLMMAGLLIAAKVRTIDIGSLGSALLRMSAVAIVPMAVSDLLSPVAAFIPLLGGLALLIVDFMLYFALLGMFFDLDESDTWHCVGVIFVINVAVYFGLPVVLRFV